uniref:Uncharacterized protein n=1 Tax=Anopheles stephensi TaxID=30069 RepID=A0A182YDL4_ANOST
MSWQDYVDNQLLASQCVSKAAIAGHDGGVWAKSEGFEESSHNAPEVGQNLRHVLEPMLYRTTTTPTICVMKCAYNGVVPE